MIALRRSCSPPSIFLISAAWTSWSSASSACANSASTDSPASDHSSSTARSSFFFLSDTARSRSCSRRRRRCCTFCASAWSFQKSGAAARASRRVSSWSGRAASKIAPEIDGPPAQFFVASLQIVNGCHASILVSWITLRPVRQPRRGLKSSMNVYSTRRRETASSASVATRGRIREHVADPRVDGRGLQKPALRRR